MWTQTWPLANLQHLDREARKITVENRGNHPQGATAVLYMSRTSGRREVRFVEHEYKKIKIKAIKLFQNPDPAFSAARMFEEKSMKTGRHSIIKDVRKYAEELGIQLQAAASVLGP